MPKKILSIFMLSLLIATSALAFNLGSVENNSVVSTPFAYQNDFDILVLDFTISDNNGVADELNAITFYNDGTANNEDINKVYVWSDAGAIGFQGYMKDKVLGEADRTDFKRWKISGLTEEIPIGGLRIFVTVETKSSINTSRVIQFVADRSGDQNSDGVFDYNDRGIFTASGNNGPDDGDLRSNTRYTLKQWGSDILAPKVAITSLNDGDRIELSDSLVITGAAKDRMQGSVKQLEISVVKQGGDDDWQSVNSLTTNFATWDYVFNNPEAGFYEIKTKASDWDSNEIITDAISIEFYAPEPVVVEEETPEEQPEEPWQDRLIKSESSPKVYLLKQDGKKYWFPVEVVFFSYYDDFGALEILPDDEVAAYPTSYNIQIKAGNLIKTNISPKVYEVGDNWQIRWIASEEEAVSLHGSDWNSKVRVLSEIYWGDYEVVEVL